jgi:hypothetical protein
MTIKEAIAQVMDGREATINLRCGAKLTIIPQITTCWYGYEWHKKILGINVFATDPHNFAGYEKETSISNKVSFYFTVEALPMIALLAGSLNRAVCKKQKELDLLHYKPLSR